MNTMNDKRPELLSPAGDFEKLQMAIHYGADAVYLAGREFGMRASSGNFDYDEMMQAVKYAHERDVKVYVTCNTLPREDEIVRLPDYMTHLQDCNVDGLIIADMGVISMAKKYAPNVPLHISTQFGIVNSETAKMLYDLGATRVVLAREMSMNEIREFRRNIPEDLEIEAFVHGAMCVSFSGRCLLSNYLTGKRDANRGQCAQPCRWRYALVEEKRPGEYYTISEEDEGTYIMNSNDMCMIDYIPEMIEAGISSFKIEGRMKSAYYAGAVTNAYRHAIDDVLAGRPVNPIWIEETEKLSHRPYNTGFYFGQPGQYTRDSAYFSGAEVCAVVESCDADGNALLTQRNKFCEGDTIELMTNDHEPIAFTASGMQLPDGTPIESTPRAMMEFKMKLPIACERLSVLRRIKEDPMRIRTNGRYAK